MGTRPSFLTSMQDHLRNSKEFIVNDSQKVVMEKHDTSLYQASYTGTKKIEMQRFDITFGGVKGETYLYWKDDRLFQLPISYSNIAHRWTSSPGPAYQINKIDFSKSIGQKCLECHASYIRENHQESFGAKKPVTLDKNSLVYSIDCERCHGPAANHVNFHSKNPSVKEANYIVKIGSLSRMQKLDMCAVCHSGISNTVYSTFEFKPGDTLANFKVPDYYMNQIDSTNLDVHGNQVQLLTSSKCYRMSTMDCSTCHNTHIKDRGNATLYASRCMSCHNSSSKNHVCKMTGVYSDTNLKNNCIKCHMPALPSKITVQASGKGKDIRFFVNTHRIAIYPQEIDKITAYLKKLEPNKSHSHGGKL